MRTISIPDIFFVLERIDSSASPPMPFFLVRDPENRPATEFAGELGDLCALIADRPEELQQRYGVKAIYAVLAVTSTKHRMLEIRDALRASRPVRWHPAGDLVWFAADADLIAEPNIGKVQWLPTAADERRPIAWDASKWVVTDYQEPVG